MSDNKNGRSHHFYADLKTHPAHEKWGPDAYLSKKGGTLDWRIYLLVLKNIRTWVENMPVSMLP
jgi:hypothetical protein